MKGGSGNGTAFSINIRVEELTISPVQCVPPVSDEEGYAASLASALNVASKDKFLLVLGIPAILRPYQGKFQRKQEAFDSDTLIYRVYGLNLPSVSVPSLPIKIGGYTGKVSSFGKKEYDPVKVNFVVDSGFQNYHFLYKWLNVLAGENGFNYDSENLRPSSKGRLGEYSTIISIFALDEYDRAVCQFLFKGAFITTLGGIEYNYQTEKEIQSDFSFEYTFYNMELIEEPFTVHAP